jgi:hypothetical protein
MLLRLIAVLTILAAASLSVQAADEAEMPKTLVIGYDQEGHVDASEAACRVFVKEMVEWEPAEMEKAVKDVCAYRKKHLDAYAALQKAYGALRDTLKEQTRFDGAAAARGIAAMVNGCIDMKWALSTGGHNVGIDMMPNAIAAECLNMGRETVERETSALTAGSGQQSGGE